MTVVGPSCIVPTSEVEPLWRFKLRRWAGGGPETQVRIKAERVSGREIGRPGVRGWLPEPLRHQRMSMSAAAGRRGDSRSGIRACGRSLKLRDGREQHRALGSVIRRIQDDHRDGECQPRCCWNSSMMAISRRIRAGSRRR